MINYFQKAERLQMRQFLKTLQSLYVENKHLFLLFYQKVGKPKKTYSENIDWILYMSVLI